MANQIFYNQDARERVLKGAKALYDAVKTTMGPKGRNVIISRQFGPPLITHDGVTVAKHIDLPKDDDDTLGWSVGAELIKEVANKMNDVAGDGTTTVTVLTYHLLREANRLIAAGHNPMLIKKGLDAVAESAVGLLDSLSEDIKDNQDRVNQVATISAGNKAIGELIAEVISKVGENGVVTVEEGHGMTLESEIVEGFTFDRGFVSPYMVTDPARMEAVYERPAIILMDRTLTSVQEMLPLLEKIAQANRKNVLLIADDVQGEMLGTLILNKIKGSFNTVAVRAPQFGDRRKDVMNDIATLTGATLISEDQGLNPANAGLEHIGEARKVIVTKDQTTIIEGFGNQKDIKARIKQVLTQKASAASEYDKEQYEKRAAALSGKVAVIRVGGVTETEIEEKKFRVDDAVAATQAALHDGIVPGGGATLLNLSQRIDVANSEPTISAGIALFKKALREPFKILLRNSGVDSGVWLANMLAEGAKSGVGIDVTNPDKGLIDLKEAGIIDPTRVTKEVIQNAVSIAGTALTMGALVVDLPNPATPVLPGQPPMPPM